MPLVILAALLAVAQPESPGESTCFAMVQGPSGIERQDLPWLVTERTAGSARFEPRLPPGSGIACVRRSIVPAPNDWKLLAAGYPLSILVPGTVERIGVLEVSQGQVRFRVLDGQLTPDEAPLVLDRLSTFQLALRR